MTEAERTNATVQGLADAASRIGQGLCGGLLMPLSQTLLLRISDFVMQNAGRIEEMDLNPVWIGAQGEGVLPLDAVIIERTAA